MTDEKNDRAALLPVDPSASQSTTEALPNIVYANGNANGAYIRIRSEFDGAWVAIGDDNTEREVWFSADEVRRIAIMLIGSGNQLSPEHSVTPRRSAAPKKGSPDA